MKKSSYLRIVLVLFVITALCLPLSGCIPTLLNWTMYGAVMDKTGQISEHLEFTVKGTLHDHVKDNDQLSIEVLTPDHYPYCLPEVDYTHTDESGKWIDLPYFSSHTYAYDKVENDGVFSVFALDIEQGYIILKWGDTGSYLVGCTDPDTDLTTVFAHFQEFIEFYQSTENAN